MAVARSGQPQTGKQMEARSRGHQGELRALGVTLGSWRGSCSPGKAAPSPPSSTFPPPAPGEAGRAPTDPQLPQPPLFCRPQASQRQTFGSRGAAFLQELSLSRGNSTHKGTVRFDSGTFCRQSGETGHRVQRREHSSPWCPGPVIIPQPPLPLVPILPHSPPKRSRGEAGQGKEKKNST